MAWETARVSDYRQENRCCVRSYTRYRAEVVRGVEFLVQLRESPGYGLRFGFFYLHESQFPPYFLLESGEEIVVDHPG